MPAVKTAEERARLDAIFAEIEAEERGEIPAQAGTWTQEQIAEDERLEKAERSAREQDNHHYYKIFAEGVKQLLEAI